MSIAAKYREFSDDDKVALKTLQKEASEKIGRPVSLSEILAAVTPGEPWPKDLPLC